MHGVAGRAGDDGILFTQLVTQRAHKPTILEGLRRNCIANWDQVNRAAHQVRDALQLPCTCRLIAYAILVFSHAVSR